MAITPQQEGWLTPEHLIQAWGSLAATVAAAVGVAAFIISRRNRREQQRHLDEPEVETKLTPLAPDWWQLDLTIRNFGATTLEIKRLSVPWSLLRARRVRLAPHDLRSAGDIGYIGEAGPVIEPSRLTRRVQLPLSAAPAGAVPTPNANYGFIPGTESVARGRCLLFAPTSSWERKVIIRMHSSRKMREERLIDTTIQLIMPASRVKPTA